jgi:hypothetical protein
VQKFQMWLLLIVVEDQIRTLLERHNTTLNPLLLDVTDSPKSVWELCFQTLLRMISLPSSEKRKVDHRNHQKLQLPIPHPPQRWYCSNRLLGLF